MTDRILLGKFAPDDYRLRIVAPGYDATSASVPDDKIVFDSSWAASPPIVMSGFVNLNNGVKPTSNDFTWVSIPFGTTFPRKPFLYTIPYVKDGGTFYSFKPSSTNIGLASICVGVYENYFEIGYRKWWSYEPPAGTYMIYFAVIMSPQ